jgi:hypothetical protein
MAGDELQGLISKAFEPVMSQLDALDLADLPLEPDLDPGRPPLPRRDVEQ